MSLPNPTTKLKQYDQFRCTCANESNFLIFYEKLENWNNLIRPTHVYASESMTMTSHSKRCYMYEHMNQLPLDTVLACITKKSTIIFHLLYFFLFFFWRKIRWEIEQERVILPLSIERQVSCEYPSLRAKFVLLSAFSCLWWSFSSSSRMDIT